MNNILRPNYTQHALSFLDKGLIIALTGQRRVGKSFILRQIADSILQNDPQANIISINKEKRQFANIKNETDLEAFVSERLVTSISNYLLIDEVQDIDGWEHTVRSLNADEECQVILTGSNAKMLSSELSTYLGGRYIAMHVQSLSFNEFLQFHKVNNSFDSLETYLTFGGMPHLYRLGLGNEDMVWEYLQNLYSTIALKDVMEREGIRNISLFENLLSFVSDNVGHIVSARSISAYLKSQNLEMSALTVLNYINAASNAYVINKVPRYDIHGKRLLENNNKYYFEDLGLRNVLTGGRKAQDFEKLMENAVYLHLKNLGWRCYVGVLPKGEIDFVAEKSGQKIYVQVTYLLSSEDTEKREFGNLMQIGDNYPKFVVSMEHTHRTRDYNGIKHVSLLDFLGCNDIGKL